MLVLANYPTFCENEMRQSFLQAAYSGFAEGNMWNKCHTYPYCVVISTFFGLNDQGRQKVMACRGHCPTCSFKPGASGVEASFHNSITGNFIVYQHRIEANSLQLFAHSENLEWRSTLLLNRNKHICNDFFVFYKFPLSSNLLLLPLALRCSGVPMDDI